MRSFSLHPQNSFVRLLIKENEQIEIKTAEGRYSLLKHQNRYMIWHARSVNDGIITKYLEEGITEYLCLVITRCGDDITVRIKDLELDPGPKATSPKSQPKEEIRQTIRDAHISIEMARVLAEEITPQNYEELTNIYELRHGDILPGHQFILGDKQTYNRELLGINLHPSSAIYKALTKAEEIGKNHKGDIQSLADKVADMVDEHYSSRQGNGANGALLTLGRFQENGGCCRHRAAELQVAFQRAGVRSRYVRGLTFLSWHAWVEVDIKGDGSYSYLIDPNMKIRGEKQKPESEDEKEATEWLKGKLRERGVYHDDMLFFYVVDHKRSKDYSPSYIFSKNKFNVVWRRKTTPPAS